MSEEEEMISKGRLVTEYSEAKKKKILLDDERERLGRTVKEIAIALEHFNPQLPNSLKDEHYEALDAEKIRSIFDLGYRHEEYLNGLERKVKALGLV